MIDPVTQSTAAAASLPEALPPPARLAHADPAETQAFSVLMDPGASQAAPARAARTELNPLQRMMLTEGSEFHERFKALDQGRSYILGAGMNDPMMVMWRAVDFSYQSTSLFTHLNLASGLATAVNNSFNSLFKNQG